MRVSERAWLVYADQHPTGSNWVFLASWAMCMVLAICLRVRGGAADWSDGEAADDYLDSANARPEKY